MSPIFASAGRSSPSDGGNCGIVRDVSIVGLGQTPVAEHWDKDLRVLAAEAILAALAEAQIERPEMLYVGNMLSGRLCDQENLGALVADHAGLRGVEAIKVEAAGASGAAAVRMAYVAVAGGLCDVAVACGVEKMTDTAATEAIAGMATALDAIYEAQHGLSLAAASALLMQRYMHEFGYEHQDFCGFSVNAHRNAMSNPRAMYHRAIRPEAYAQAGAIAAPLTVLDSAGMGDGAAAVVLTPTEFARTQGLPAVRIAGSAVTTDSVALHDRRDSLSLEAAHLSAQRAYAQAQVGPENIDFFEPHDAYSILAVLSLEASGFADRGQGVRLAMEDQISLSGRIPICTMGGLKARGHPIGASGAYQIVEAALQLRGRAGDDQVRGCRVGMTQSIGGSGAIAITHILEKA
mgnify:CR=1 FL=1